MPPTEIDEAAARVQAGCPTDRTGAGIPGRFGIRTIRNARFPMKAPGGLHSGNAPKNERDEEWRIPRALYPFRGVPHPRATEPEMRPGRERSVRESGSALRSPGARKARATGFRAARVGLA